MWLTLFSKKLKSNHHIRHTWIRVWSILIVISFIFPYVTWAFDNINYLVTTVQLPEIRHLNKVISIPEKNGTILNGFQGKEKSVVLIQDLHCNYEVQKNIATIIKNLVKNHQLKLIAQEGAYGPVDTSVISAFPIRKVRENVSDYFVKQGEITGAEHYTILSGGAVHLEGIESKELYQASQKAVKGFLNSESQGIVYDLRGLLEELKPQIYHDQLLTFDKKTKAFRQGDVDLLKYAAQLLRIARRLNINEDNYPQVSQYLSLNKAFFSSAINQEQLFIELEQLDQQIRRNIYTNDYQRELDEYIDRLDIIERLLNISVTSEELDAFRKQREKYSIKEFIGFFNRVEAIYTLSDPSDLPLHSINELYRLDHFLNDVQKFYRLADERSYHFVKNLLNKMNDLDENMAVMVNGGFHSVKVLKELKKRNITYITVRPQVSQHDIINPYFELLQDRQTPIEKLLAKNQTIMAILSRFYKHSARVKFSVAVEAIAVRLKRQGRLSSEKMQAIDEFAESNKIVKVYETEKTLLLLGSPELRSGEIYTAQLQTKNGKFIEVPLLRVNNEQFNNQFRQVLSKKTKSIMTIGPEDIILLESFHGGELAEVIRMINEEQTTWWIKFREKVFELLENLQWPQGLEPLLQETGIVPQHSQKVLDNVAQTVGETSGINKDKKSQEYYFDQVMENVKLGQAAMEQQNWESAHLEFTQATTTYIEYLSKRNEDLISHDDIIRWATITETSYVFNINIESVKQNMFQDHEILKEILMASLLLSNNYYHLSRPEFNEVKAKTYGIIKHPQQLNPSDMEDMGMVMVSKGDRTSSQVHKLKHGKDIYYIKPLDPEVAIAEMLSQRIYAILGFSTMDTHIVNWNGESAIITKEVPDTINLSDYINKILKISNLFNPNIIIQRLLPVVCSRDLQSSKLVDIILQYRDAHLGNYLLRIDQSGRMLPELPIFFDRGHSFGDYETVGGLASEPYRGGFEKDVISSGRETRGIRVENPFHLHAKPEYLQQLAPHIVSTLDKETIEQMVREVLDEPGLQGVQISPDFSFETLSSKLLEAVHSVKTIYKVDEHYEKFSQRSLSLDSTYNAFPKLSKRAVELIIAPWYEFRLKWIINPIGFLLSHDKNYNEHGRIKWQVFGPRLFSLVAMQSLLFYFALPGLAGLGFFMTVIIASGYLSINFILFKSIEIIKLDPSLKPIIALLVQFGLRLDWLINPALIYFSPDVKTSKGKLNRIKLARRVLGVSLTYGLMGYYMPIIFVGIVTGAGLFIGWHFIHNLIVRWAPLTTNDIRKPWEVLNAHLSPEARLHKYYQDYLHTQEANIRRFTSTMRKLMLMRPEDRNTSEDISDVVFSTAFLTQYPSRRINTQQDLDRLFELAKALFEDVDKLVIKSGKNYTYKDKEFWINLKKYYLPIILSNYEQHKRIYLRELNRAPFILNYHDGEQVARAMESELKRAAKVAAPEVASQQSKNRPELELADSIAESFNMLSQAAQDRSQVTLQNIDDLESRLDLSKQIIGEPSTIPINIARRVLNFLRVIISDESQVSDINKAHINLNNALVVANRINLFPQDMTYKRLELAGQEITNARLRVSNEEGQETLFITNINDLYEALPEAIRLLTIGSEIITVISLHEINALREQIENLEPKDRIGRTMRGNAARVVLELLENLINSNNDGTFDEIELRCIRLLRTAEQRNLISVTELQNYLDLLKRISSKRQGVISSEELQSAVVFEEAVRLLILAGTNLSAVREGTATLRTTLSAMENNERTRFSNVILDFIVAADQRSGVEQVHSLFEDIVINLFADKTISQPTMHRLFAMGVRIKNKYGSLPGAVKWLAEKFGFDAVETGQVEAILLSFVYYIISGLLIQTAVPLISPELDIIFYLSGPILILYGLMNMAHKYGGIVGDMPLTKENIKEATRIAIITSLAAPALVMFFATYFGIIPFGMEILPFYITAILISRWWHGLSNDQGNDREKIFSINEQELKARCVDLLLHPVREGSKYDPSDLNFYKDNLGLQTTFNANQARRMLQESLAQTKNIFGMARLKNYTNDELTVLAGLYLAGEAKFQEQKRLLKDGRSLSLTEQDKQKIVQKLRIKGHVSKYDTTGNRIGIYASNEKTEQLLAWTATGFSHCFSVLSKMNQYDLKTSLARMDDLIELSRHLSNTQSDQKILIDGLAELKELVQGYYTLTIRETLKHNKALYLEREQEIHDLLNKLSRDYFIPNGFILVPVNNVNGISANVYHIEKHRNKETVYVNKPYNKVTTQQSVIYVSQATDAGQVPFIPMIHNGHIVVSQAMVEKKKNQILQLYSSSEDYVIMPESAHGLNSLMNILQGMSPDPNQESKNKYNTALEQLDFDSFVQQLRAQTPFTDSEEESQQLSIKMNEAYGVALSINEKLTSYPRSDPINKRTDLESERFKNSKLIAGALLAQMQDFSQGPTQAQLTLIELFRKLVSTYPSDRNDEWLGYQLAFQQLLYTTGEKGLGKKISRLLSRYDDEHETDDFQAEVAALGQAFEALQKLRPAQLQRAIDNAKRQLTDHRGQLGNLMSYTLSEDYRSVSPYQGTRASPLGAFASVLFHASETATDEASRGNSIIAILNQIVENPKHSDISFALFLYQEVFNEYAYKDDPEPLLQILAALERLALNADRISRAFIRLHLERNLEYLKQSGHDESIEGSLIEQISGILNNIKVHRQEDSKANGQGDNIPGAIKWIVDKFNLTAEQTGRREAVGLGFLYALTSTLLLAHAPPLIIPGLDITVYLLVSGTVLWAVMAGLHKLGGVVGYNSSELTTEVIRKASTKAIITSLVFPAIVVFTSANFLLSPIWLALFYFIAVTISSAWHGEANRAEPSTIEKITEEPVTNLKQLEERFEKGPNERKYQSLIGQVFSQFQENHMIVNGSQNQESPSMSSLVLFPSNFKLENIIFQSAKTVGVKFDANGKVVISLPKPMLDIIVKNNSDILSTLVRTFIRIRLLIAFWSMATYSRLRLSINLLISNYKPKSIRSGLLLILFLNSVKVMLDRILPIERNPYLIHQYISNRMPIDYKPTLLEKQLNTIINSTEYDNLMNKSNEFTKSKFFEMLWFLIKEKQGPALIDELRYLSALTHVLGLEQTVQIKWIIQSRESNTSNLLLPTQLFEKGRLSGAIRHRLKNLPIKYENLPKKHHKLHLKKFSQDAA